MLTPTSSYCQLKVFYKWPPNENQIKISRLDMRYAKFLNSIEEVSEAVELVDDALKHEPIFNDSLSKAELSDFNSKQDLQTLEEEEEEDTRSVHVFIEQF